VKYPGLNKLLVLAVLSAISLLGGAAKADIIWTAYNDCIREPADSTAENATDWTIYSGYTSHAAGKLKNFATGSDAGMPTVTFTMNLTSPVLIDPDYGNNFAAGTPAHAVFDGKVDFGGPIIQHSSLIRWWVEIQFTGLDPTRKYTFAGSAARIWADGIDNRRSLFAIKDADAYTNNSGYHTIGDPNWVGTDTTKFLAVNNDQLGVVVQWDDIVPGPDGDFTIRAEADTSEGSHGRQAYPFGGFMLQQIGVAGNQPPVVGAGPDRQTTLPDNTVNLDGTVEDDGLGLPQGFLEFSWSKVSGPGEVTFDPNQFVKDPTAVFEPLQPGVYVLRLEAADGEMSAFDEVTITVNDSICPTGDLTGDCIVNAGDIEVFAGQWLVLPPGSADLDGDKNVELGDFAWMAKNWRVNAQRGSVHAAIAPQDAIDAGAKWRVDKGEWCDSGYTQGDLTVGTHTVQFNDLAGWDKPADKQVQVNYAETTSTSGAYVQQKGSLKVTISPQAAIDAGAQWRADAGDWCDGGYTQSNIPVGLHTVEYKTLSGWAKPISQPVQINKNATTVITGTYQELPDTPVVISEFMAVNSYVPFISSLNIYTEVFGQDRNPDWIELHNLDLVNTLDLEGWYLTNDAENLTMWCFPAGVRIGPNGYYILFASGKTQADNPGNYPFVDGDGALHTNFALGSGGDYLALVMPDGVTVAHQYAPQYPGQRGFVSYGISSSGEVGYLTTPTPGSKVLNKWTGAPNSARYDGVVADTKFSPDRGFYYAPFSVTITCDTPGATIRYTTDGSEPTLTRGATVTGPIPINTTTPLRAAAFRTGWLSTNVDAQTYLFPAQVAKQTHARAIAAGFPTYWGNGADYEMDPEIYNDPAYRDVIEPALSAIPTLSLVTDKDHLFGSTSGIYTHPTSIGMAWERPVSAEFFDANGVKEFHANCGIRIQGGASREPPKAPKHSMSLRFRGGYGPGELEYSLFEGSRVDRFNSLQLRAMFNNSWIHWDSGQRRRGSLIRDQWIRDSLLDMGQDSACRGTYAHLYLNGIYWGVYNVHERSDASHYASYYGGDEDRLDALKSGAVVDGTAASWNNLQNMVASAAADGVITLAEYQQIEQKLDVAGFIDYIIVNHYGENDDWDGHNWRAAGGGMNDALWRIFSWDGERVLEDVGGNVTGVNYSGCPSRLFHNMRKSPEFCLLFGDRLHKHFFNNGAMMPANTAARWMRRAAELDLAVICESARWGDYRRDVHPYSSGPYELYAKNTHWLPEQNRLIDTYFPGRSTNVFNTYKNSLGLYPSLAAPAFSPHGGWSLNGFTLTMSTPAAVYYTLDGADPRLPGGALNTTHAIAYSGAVSLTASTHVKARAKSGSAWSALNEAVFGVGPVADSLRITEIMYNPKNTGHPDDPNEEFIELKNIGATTINLNLVRFTNGVDFTFPSCSLGAGQYVLVVRNQAAFAAQYPTVPAGIIAGQYAGSLDNGGERIELVDALGRIIHNFRYRDGWFSITDGMGFSLTIKDPNNADPNEWDSKSAWRTSASSGGSPGWDDSGEIPPAGTVVINEFLAHSHDDASDWIELHNTTNDAVDIGGWFLSDSSVNVMKYEIAEGTYIDPCGYFVFYQDPNFGVLTDPGAHEPFALSENGEAVYLHVGRDGELMGFMDEEQFDASETGVSFGRYRKSTGTYNFVPMDHNTPGWENAYPKIGPIVIAEIMYHPTDPCAGDPYTNDSEFEYIELYNVTGSPVTLREWDDVKGIFVPWWIDGVGYTFPASTTIPANTRLIVARNPAAFTYRYGALPGGVELLGPCGKMKNEGETIQLSKPGDEMLAAPGVYYGIRVDRVNYSDGSHDDDFPELPGGDPWPIEPDGWGYSLTKTWPNLYGNDPNNWTAQLPSPGE
jgi:hypothetical protein